jgi:hypothetical protein
MLLSSDLKHGVTEEGENIDIFSVLLDHGLHVSSGAAAKRPTVDFLVRLLLVGFLSIPSTLFDD